MNNFTEKFDSWLKLAQECVDKYNSEHFPNLPRRVLEVMEGKKYIRVLSNDGGLNKSAWAFIDKENGNVLKPASWKKPAKHARGNIFDADNGMKFIGPYGPAYLK